MNSISIVKLFERTQLSHSQVVDVKPIIYVATKWLDDQLEINVARTSSNQNYRGELKYTEIKNAAEELEQPYEAFLDECKTALTTNMGLQGFDYELSKEEDADTVFNLYKCTGFETLYLDIRLRKVSNCFTMLDLAMEMGSQAEQQPVQAEQITGKGLEDYEQFVIESKKREEKLMKKFLLLINAKKSKIEELERQLNGGAGAVAEAENEDTDKEEDDEDFGAATQALGLE